MSNAQVRCHRDRQRDRGRDRPGRRRLSRQAQAAERRDEPHRHRDRRAPVRRHGPRQGSLGRIGREHDRGHRRARRAHGLHRQGGEGPARRRLHARHARGRRDLRHARRSSAGCRRRGRSSSSRPTRSGRCRPSSAPPRSSAPRTSNMELHHRLEGAVPRGLSLGSAARQGGDAQRRHRRAEGRRQGVVHAVRLVLRGALPRRVPGARREARGHPVRQRARDPVALRGGELRRRAAEGARPLRDRGADAQREGVGGAARRRGARDRRGARREGGGHDRRRRRLRGRVPLRLHAGARPGDVRQAGRRDGGAGDQPGTGRAPT